jgi:hypothetical protein
MARKRQRRQRVHGKYLDLEHLRTWFELRTVDKLRAVSDPDHAGRITLGDVIHTDERRYLDRGADLLDAFAHRCVGGMLVVVDEPPG